MAGAGFKTFNTGDVLTASDVNTYLMQQTVMVFADSSARSTALGANVAEGMLSYLKDTNAVEVYNGSAWVSSDDPNAIQNTIVDAKGDIITATAADTPARLAVGADGYTLVADSSTSTGLAYVPTFFAGKNKIINGDFSINQRAFTSNTTNGAYNFDRWLQINNGGSATVTPQTFTAGTAPVTGYEAANFLQIITASQSASGDYAIIAQRIEDVRTLANETATISFWAKTASGTPKIAVEIEQSFGSGGSPSSAVQTYAGQITLSTSWARYSVTVAIPSISGKTIGTTANTSSLNLNFWVSAGSGFNTRTGSLGLQNATFQLWGVQVEAGSTATQFQTATGTIQGELAACQRYYRRFSAGGSASYLGFGSAFSTTKTTTSFYTGTMRITPTTLDYSGINVADGVSGYATTAASLVAATSTPDISNVDFTVASGLTQYRPYFAQATGTTSYVGFSAEL